ncbi:MAG: phosphate ABC transporter substrate-binding protein PstS [Elusimicrobiota bacterium]
MFKKCLVIFLLSVVGFFHATHTKASALINGAGATFPYPIYSKWFDMYHKLNPEVRINYQSIGSGGGIRQFLAKTIDFGATDAPMNEKEMAQAEGTVFHVPTVLGGVVPSFNVQGVETLNFTGEVLAKIYLGKITKWSDQAIRDLNPDAKLPKEEIVVIRRADGSGTTFCFTDYLSTVSPDWSRKVGKGESVNWPVGLGGKGNEGVAGLIRKTKNSLGYVELVYAKQMRMSYGAVKNSAGIFVKADLESVSSAGNAISMPEDFRVSIVNAPGEKSYPISTFTWLLVKEQNTGDVGTSIRSFLEWMLSDGQKVAPQLDYAPLPDHVKEMVRKMLPKIK